MPACVKDSSLTSLKAWHYCFAGPGPSDAPRSLLYQAYPITLHITVDLTFVLHPTRRGGTIIEVLQLEIAFIGTKRQNLTLMLDSLFPTSGLPAPQEAFVPRQRCRTHFFLTSSHFLVTTVFHVYHVCIYMCSLSSSL